MSDSNVTDLNQWREDRTSSTRFFTTVYEVAPTGSRPLLVRADNGSKYWCKQLNNSQGPEVVVNELVTSIIGDAIGAPIPKWTILRPSPTLIGKRFRNSRNPNEMTCVFEEPVFGSLVVDFPGIPMHSSVFQFVDDNSNQRRIARLIALILICNGQDVQFSYEKENDNTIWCFDFGFWFDSHESPWGLTPHDAAFGRPDLPSLHTCISERYWHEAIDTLNQLNATALIEDITHHLPEEWKIPEACVIQLVRYAIERRDYAKQELSRLQQAYF